MSLDERTLEWLKGKSDADNPAPCGLFSMHYCLKACEDNRAASPELCPLASDFREAAEFEARVAAKLTGLNAAELPCYPNFLCLFSAKHLGMGCKDCFLKYARLAVETEMEMEKK